jgi:hypothetical protein
LTFAVQMQQLAKVLFKIPDRAYGIVDAEMSCVNVAIAGNQKNHFAATIEFAE